MCDGIVEIYQVAGFSAFALLSKNNMAVKHDNHSRPFESGNLFSCLSSLMTAVNKQLWAVMSRVNNHQKAVRGLWVLWHVRLSARASFDVYFTWNARLFMLFQNVHSNLWEKGNVGSHLLISKRMHSPFPQCAVGSQVAMRVGGDFFFDPSPSDPAVDLLLVAGGVGINPLYSVLLHTTDLMHLKRSSGGRDYNIGSVHLSYSAKNTQELLFKVWLKKHGSVSACGVHACMCCGGWAATICVSRAPSSRHAGNSLTSSPAISTSRNRAQMSTPPSRLSSAVSSAHRLLWQWWFLD